PHALVCGGVVRRPRTPAGAVAQGGCDAGRDGAERVAHRAGCAGQSGRPAARAGTRDRAGAAVKVLTGRFAMLSSPVGSGGNLMADQGSDRDAAVVLTRGAGG